jgi:hypothetical protein
MKQGFVYMWESLTTGKKYIGSHYGLLDDGYVSSSKHFNEIYRSNPSSFSRKILRDKLSRKEALTMEKDLLISVNAAASSDYYNLHNEPGNGWSHHSDPDLARIYYDKISKARKGQPSKSKGRNIWTTQNRHKLRIDRWLVRTPSGETFEIENMLSFCKQHDLNPSAMSAVARGNRRIYKGYWCKKLTNNRKVQYSHKEWESKGKSGKAWFGKENSQSRPITIYGVTYDCMREASDATGLSLYKLRKMRIENE